MTTRQASFYQGDGTAPETPLSEDWPGEKGIRVSYHRFRGGAYMAATPADHLIFITTRIVPFIQCRLADECSEHTSMPRDISICPADVSCQAETNHGANILVLSVPKESLALAAADRVPSASQLIGQVNGRDDTLASLGHALAANAAAGFDDGPLGWDVLTDKFIERLISCHLSSPVKSKVGLLSDHSLHQAREFIKANFDAPISVSAIAAAAGQSRAHFTRLFLNTVGVSPHRYVVQVRLKHALCAIRRKRVSFAEAAFDSGFASQSHLANWTRRVYGATLKELVP